MREEFTNSRHAMTAGRRSVVLLVGGGRMPRLAEAMRAVAPDAAYRLAARAAEGEPWLAEANVVVLADRATPAYASAPRLEWLHLYPTGIDHVSIPALRSAIFPITHKAAGSVVPMAEHAMALLLSIVRRLADFRDLQGAADWRSFTEWPATSLGQLRGKTLGIVGLGRVGRAIARRAKAFDMRVVAATRSPGAGDPIDAVLPREELYTVLAQADFVVLSTPLNDETFHLIDAAALTRMKPGAWLVNIARGPVVDERALIQALDAGAIGGAALDTFEDEPLDRTSPLWRLPNVIVTPHVAGSGPDNEAEATAEIVANFRRYLAGEPLVDRIDARDIPTRPELVTGSNPHA